MTKPVKNFQRPGPGPRTSLVVLLVLGIALLSGCDYGRMKEDEAVQPYRGVMPAMPRQSIPNEGGIQSLRTANPFRLVNPLPFTPRNVATGRERYEIYCSQCHGEKADGNGTVGQSFAPLPANLREFRVQNQADGELFYKISLGFERHPPLWYTIWEPHRWAIVHYLRSLEPS